MAIGNAPTLPTIAKGKGEVPRGTQERCAGDIQGIQVLKNTNRNYVRTTRWSDGAHSVIDKCFEKSKVRLVEVSIDTACYS